MYGGKAGKRPLKRPLRSLTVHDKLNAITRVLFRGETKASVARDIGVPESTLRGWCKNHENISKQAATSPYSQEDTPESHHIRHAKRIKLEYQSYNLNGSYSPNIESNFESEYQKSSKPESDTSPLDLCTAKPADTLPVMIDSSTKEPIDNISAVAKLRQDKEREKSRAELARLGAELGLNRPEMLPPTLNSNNLPELTMALGQLTWYQHWYHLQQQALQQQIQTSTVGSTTDPNAPNNGLLTMDESEKMLPNIEQQRSVYDYVSFWLKQQTMMGLGNSSQQSTMALNPCLPSTSTMPSASNTTTSAANYDHESIEHGLQFLRALEHCSHPSITMLQIYKFRDLMKNLQTRYNYKSGDSHK